MYGKGKSKVSPIRLRRHLGVLAALWTLVVVAMWIWSLYHQKLETRETARHQARAAFEKDLVYRAWVADHGGVYVPVTENTQPNPYLAHIEERDITTPSGRLLTLVDPGYMTRQVHELGAVRSGLRGHITSLTPLRPENAADPWETRALDAFERGAQEVTSLEEMDGEPHLRLMRPLLTEETCLKCHAGQGYEVGDILGAISVSVPMVRLLAIGRSHMIAMSYGFSVLWMLGLGGIGFETLRLRERIQERDQADAERLRLATALEQAVECILLMDTAGMIQFVNPAFKKLTGYSSDEATGAESDFFLDKEECPENTLPDMEQIVKQSDAWRGRLVIKTKEGLSRQVETTISPVFDPFGEVAGFVGIYRDVTREAELEAQLRHAQKMEAIGILAGGIAHDFNNILAAILGFSELTARGLPEDSHGRENIREVIKAANRATALVKQILAFSHRMEPERRPLRIQYLIEEIKELLRSSLPSTIDIRFHIDTGVGVILADPTEIHQVIMNLCTNAYHAMPDEGGVLDISLSDYELGTQDAAKHPSLEPGPYACLTISDTGQGMSKATMDRAFEPYFTTKEKGTGTGLGLATVHGIVTNLGGAISLQSALGRGTKVTVLFPCFVRDGRTKTVENVDTVLPEGNERILFVDDEKQLVRLHRMSLERLGYTVTAFSDSSEALAAFRANPHGFDLVITDQTMPKLTGTDLAKRITEIRPNIPIILCTGNAELLSKEQTAGIWEFLQKPTARCALATTIRQVLTQVKTTEACMTAKVLVVDDDEQVRLMLRRTLEHAGYEVREASNGKVAIQLHRQEPADLIVTDIIMPEQEGIETILKLHREFADTKIIAISGGGRGDAALYLSIAEKSGASRTLLKPINCDEFLSAVQELVSQV